MINCAQCKKTFETEKSLHAHIKAHDFKVADYYRHFYPQNDKLTGEPIPFKNREQYFGSAFISRRNLIKWLLQHLKRGETDGSIYALELLKNRKEEKGLVYAPSHVELKTLMIPSIEYFKMAFGDYNIACEKVGLQRRFDYNQNFIFSNNDLIILQDTREQSPIIFSTKRIIQKLEIGDYTAAGDLFKNIFIERKSLGDLLSTLSVGYERFQRELDRTKELGAYLVVVCENSFKDFLSFPSLSNIRSQAQPSFIQHRMRELMDRNLNVQFIFVNDRAEAGRIIPVILKMINKIDSVDLQYYYDLRIL